MARQLKARLRRTCYEHYLGGRKRPPIIKEEFWQDERGNVIRYSLAYIDWEIFSGDNGRVLGYDNAHNYHHRHFMGIETEYDFVSYTEVARRFRREVEQLRRKHK